MISFFKEKKISNSLLVFNYYKKVTGRSLEKDLIKIQRYSRVLDDPNATDEEIERAIENNDLDSMEVLQNIYYSMRCAAELKDLEFAEVINELTVEDLADGSINNLVENLVNVKKKEATQKRFFLKK